MLLCDETYWILSLRLSMDFSLNIGARRHSSIKGGCLWEGLACIGLTHWTKMNQFTYLVTFIQPKHLHFVTLSPDLCPPIKILCWLRSFFNVLKEQDNFCRENINNNLWVWLLKETRNQAASLSHSPSRAFYYLLMLSNSCKSQIGKFWEVAWQKSVPAGSHSTKSV